MPNEIQNKEHYLNIANNLDNIANLFRQMTQGNVTLTNVAKTLNMGASQLGPAMFKDSRLKSKLKLTDDLLKLIKESMSPHERLISDIYQINIKDIIITISDIQENEINNIILNSLTDKQIIIIAKLYGLNGEKPSTLSQIGDDINITPERVRQIKAKAIRKLRYRLTAFYEYSNENIQDPASYEGQIQILENKITQLNKQLLNAELKVNHLEIQLQKKSNNNDPTKINIEDLNLSTRSYGCLKRANINTLMHLASLDETQLHKIRNLGEKSINEIKNILKIHGFKLGQYK